MSDTQVLIVGAGPTGLALGLFLAHNGIKPRIIDKATGPGQESRAMVVQARTLEFYNQLSFATDVVNNGIKMEAAHVWDRGKQTAEIRFGDFGGRLSPYPFALSLPQDDHERLLGRKLKALGIDIEWSTELLSTKNEETCQSATIHKKGIESTITADYVCGCDGVHSAVRQSLGLGFEGGTYDQDFYVADVEASGPAALADGFSMCLGPHELCLCFPIRSTGLHRLTGVVPEGLKQNGEIEFKDLQPYILKLVEIRVARTSWFSTYHVHHRVADRFSVGHTFILGDAGHVHSPAGGQGMNTGIGDAVNLAWKLAAVIQGRAAESILGTYETERIAFARSLVSTTDRLFRAMVGQSAAGELMREVLVPHLVPFLFGFSAVRAAAFRFISQTRISYHESPLTEGEAGSAEGGDRLPWTATEDGTDNYAPLKMLDWQLHIYGAASEAIRGMSARTGLHLAEFAWRDGMDAAGLARDAVYLVRPDGYIGYADSKQDAVQLRAYLNRFKIAPRQT